MRANDKQKNLNVIEDEAQLTDLGLTDEELDGIKGGRLTGSEDGGGGIGGDWVINHNETTAADIELADVGLTDEELDGIKGGRLTGSEDGGGGGMGGDWVLNHNETTARDNATEIE